MRKTCHFVLNQHQFISNLIIIGNSARFFVKLQMGLEPTRLKLARPILPECKV